MSFERIIELIKFLCGKDNIRVNTEPTTFVIYQNRDIVIESDADHNIFSVLLGNYEEVFYYDKQKKIIEKRPIKQPGNLYHIMHSCYNNETYMGRKHIFSRDRLFMGMPFSYSMEEYFITMEELNEILNTKWKWTSDVIIKKYMLIGNLMHRDATNLIIGKLCLLGGIIKI